MAESSEQQAPVYKNVNVAELFGGASGAVGQGDIVWSDAQKRDMDMRIAKARMNYRKTQMRVQRGGQARYELRKRQMEMKNNHIPQSLAVTPNDRTDPNQTVNIGNFPKGAKKTETTAAKAKNDLVSSAVSSKAKRTRANRAARKKKQREAKQQQAHDNDSGASGEEKSPEVIEVAGTGTDYDKIRLHLTDEPHDAAQNDGASDLSPVLGGASETVEISEMLQEK